MKRGFLVDKNKTDKNKKPETPVAQSSQKVFAHPQYRYDTPGASPQADDEFKCTVMPPLPRAPLFQDTSGGGPYSLCLFNGRRQELAILSTPGFPSAVPKATQTRCRLGSSSDGIRMFAACRIDPGDLVVAERPLFLMPAAATGVPVKIPPSFQASPAQVMQLQMRQYNMMLEKCLNRLPPEDKNAFYEFKTHDRKEGLGPILDRMEMNGLSVVVTSADGKERFENSAIFKQVSRIRHRCTPNATWDFDVASFSMRISALCPIEKDEEIFISYIETGSLRGQERRKILRKYGITCRCALCTKLK